MDLTLEGTQRNVMVDHHVLSRQDDAGKLVCTLSNLCILPQESTSMLEFRCALKDNGYVNKAKYGKDKRLRLGDEHCLTGSFYFSLF